MDGQIPDPDLIGSPRDAVSEVFGFPNRQELYLHAPLAEKELRIERYMLDLMHEQGISDISRARAIIMRNMDMPHIRALQEQLQVDNAF